MKTLIFKEIRENLKLAVPAFLLLTGLSTFAAWDGGGNALVSAELLRTISLGCAGFAAALGWLQIHHEKPRDLWAFLVHRPITRTDIFFAKIIAGVLIYLLTVCLPMFGYLIWISVPGHLSAPFEWGMALPGVGCALLGLPWYFGAMLTSLREARWYGSRGLGLAAALPLHVFALRAPGLFMFWQYQVGIVFLAVAVALAVWGGFQADGQYSGQPLAGKAALAGVFALGASVAVVLAVMIAATALRSPDHDAYYAVTKGGAVFRVATQGNQPAVITDLSGVQLKYPKTGINMELEEFNRQVATQYSASADLADPPQAIRHLLEPRDFFYVPWRAADGIRWYWTRQGRLEGYEGRTHRFVGGLGPHGPVGANPVSEEGFLRPDFSGNQLTPRTLATSNTVYELDLRNRAAKPIFTVPAGDRIAGTRDVSDSATMVVSKQFIQLVDPNGKIVCQLPHDPNYREPRYVTVFPLEARDHYVLWIYSPRLQSQRLEGKIDRQMVRISGREAGPRIELEPPNPPRPGDGRFDQALSLFVPPEFPFIKPLLLRAMMLRVPIQWRLVDLAVVSAVLCAVAGWFIGRRYRFSVQAQLAWALFHLLAGFPGLLAFLCVHEWPAREGCPACRRLRLVDREHCEHCGANFAPPQKTGTEIFTPLDAGKVSELVS